MRALVVSHMYPSRVTPMHGSFVHNQVRYLLQHVAVEVVAPLPWWPFPGRSRWTAYRTLPVRETLDGVSVSRPRYACIPRRHFAGWTWRAFGRAVRPFLETGPTLLHAHSTYPDGLVAVEAGRRRGLPVVLTVHGDDVKVWPHLSDRWRQRVTRALTGADAVIAVSHELGNLVRGFGVPAERIECIPNGVDFELFPAASRRVDPEGGWRLLYVGRFDAAKGLHDLVDAMGILRAQRRDVKLDMVGGDRFTGTGEVFREHARRLGIDDCIQFHPAVPMAEVARYLATAHVFVLPSLSEGLPLVVLEAVATGLPVVATRCGGPEEVVEPGMGRLVDVGDAPGLAQAIGGVIDGYGDYDQSAIRATARERYDYARVAERITAVYRRVVHTRVADRQTDGSG